MADAAILRSLDAHMARGNELIEQIRADGRRNAEEWASNRQVLRELVLDMRELREESRQSRLEAREAAREALEESREARLEAREAWQELRQEMKYEFRLQREGLQSVVDGLQRMLDEWPRPNQG